MEEASKKDAFIQELTAKLAHEEALLNRDGNNAAGTRNEKRPSLRSTEMVEKNGCIGTANLNLKRNLIF